MPSDTQEIIFLLGAAGYLGSQLLVLLGQRLPQLPIKALVRNLDAEKQAQLKVIRPDIDLVDGSLDDVHLIREQASQAKYVVNCASSDHDGCVRAILEGLEQQTARRPSDPPLYLHVSGTGIICDNARGEFIPEENVPQYVDTELDLEKLPPNNPHLNCDKLIFAAGTRKGNPVRTAIVFPGYIYSIGEGIKKSTAAIRAFVKASTIAKRAGTWGPGLNSYRNIHVKDVAKALLMILEAALVGKADTGAEGLYFVTSDNSPVPFRDLFAVIGDVMFSNGLTTQGGSQPLPPSVTDAYGDIGWVLFGSNTRGDAQRLKKLGWEPTKSRKLPPLKTLPQEVEVALQELRLVPLKASNVTSPVRQ